MEAVVDRENMLNAYKRVVDTIKVQLEWTLWA